MKKEMIVVSIYVMSDCHGRFDKFKSMLEQISFSDDDELYVLGDVIDRNENGIDILLYIIEHSNIHFIVGNHEDMFYKTVKNNHLILNNDNTFSFNDDMDLWFSNGGEVTARDFLSRDIEIQNKIINYLENCDIVIPNLKVDNKYYYLVHAFPNEKLKSIQYVDNIGKYSLIQVLWERFYKLSFDLPVNLILNNYFPKDKVVIFGHTIAMKYHYYYGNYGKYLPRGLYQHFDNDNNLRFIAIDCGCALKTKEEQVLCCLRLDDMEQFYI
jgi:serine/threonine protein phosphatase 1